MRTKLTENTKPGKRFLVFLIIGLLIFSFSACGGGAVESKGNMAVTVERELGPEALKIANEATAMALRQYVYARLLTEDYIEQDISNITMKDLSLKIDNLLLAWQNAESFSKNAMDLTERAVMVLEMTTGKQESLAKWYLGKSFFPIAYGAERDVDIQTWAEDLTDQFDALRGANRYQQLAKQLGTDTKTAVERMNMAQKIIINAAELEEAQAVVNAYTDSINYLTAIKTTSKVAMVGWSMAATGGASVGLLEGAGLVVGGADCIVEVYETGSTIVLGEDHKVTTAFSDIKEKMAPVSAIIGLVTLDPKAVGKTAKDTVDTLAYVTDSLLDFIYEDKIIGIKIEGVSKDAVTMGADVFEIGDEEALLASGFVFPETEKTISQVVESWEPDASMVMDRMEKLDSQMVGLENKVSGLTSGKINISGIYTQVSTNNYDDEEDIAVVKLEVSGNIVNVTDEDGEVTAVNYDPKNNNISYKEGDTDYKMKFTREDGTVVGNGYMKTVIWGMPVELTVVMTKTSD